MAGGGECECGQIVKPQGKDVNQKKKSNGQCECKCFIYSGSALWWKCTPILVRALYQYRRGHGLESCSARIFFKFYFHNYSSRVYDCRVLNRI